MKTAQEIYKESWAKWVNDVFINDHVVMPDDLKRDDEHLWIYEAMNEYAKQQAIAFSDWNNIPVGSYDTTDELYELFLKSKQP